MRTIQLRLNRVAKLGLLLMVGVSLSACGAGSVKWKEEVQLSDGRVIVVERETIREGGGDEWAFNRSGSKPKEYRIRFANPDGSGSMIEWRSKKNFETWPEIPLVFDVVAGQPIVFSLVGVSTGCEVFSKYVYHKSAWVEDFLPQKFEQRETNLLIFDDRNMQQFIKLEAKRQKNADSHTQGFRRVGPNLKICG